MPWGAATLAGLVALTALGAASPARTSDVGAAEPSAQAPSGLEEVVLTDGRGQPFRLEDFVRVHRLTVLVFYAAGCPCFAAHLSRLLELERVYARDDVKFVVVDSERHGSPEPGAPAIGGGLLAMRDQGGKLARNLEAKFATESFVFDSAGRLRYRGGIDGDRKYLSPAPKTHLLDALGSLVSGTAPAFTTSKALGCALKLR
jgi:hypothetical protein